MGASCNGCTPAQLTRLGWSADGLDRRVQGATPGAQAAVQEAVQKATGSEVLIHFSVRDTGIGISQPNISRLFQSFSQVLSQASFQPAVPHTQQSQDGQSSAVAPSVLLSVSLSASHEQGIRGFTLTSCLKVPGARCQVPNPPFGLCARMRSSW